ncbi:MAG: hypothetical protein A3D92_14050 [Bacteroidetes bacterium RIFCSPHIGHO2_02_FULL_44_7]|nr:MAG: hypothetical protein A3D92_14050 [Bacteroidetes bacterium RIFCSPHIGHO2_02_FULL_44_7]
MKLKLLASALLVTALQAFGQQRMILFLADKSANENPELQFSARAEERRNLAGVEKDDYDLGLNPTHLAALREKGRILNTSRWLNAVSYETNYTADEVRAQFAFVERIRAIGPATASSIDKFANPTKSLDYGLAIDQVNQLNLQCLHEQGFTGTGMYLGIIDAGFQGMDNNVYFDSVFLENRVLDLYNFVDGTGLVYQYSTHGTSVASCIVGEKPSPEQYAGTAVNVDLALYLAEDVFSETEIEEFNVVAALERADSVGVDVVNISLGYFEFDDTLTSHVYAELDGNTTICAMGVNVAASKGIAVVMSAGNSGPSNISTPCDSDDGLCIGAVDVNGSYAFFSSVGPNADGQVKPDVMARGWDTWVVVNPDTVVMGSGTSFSSPVMAGATACLRQANPTKTVAQIFDAIRQIASQFTTPDPFMGYGIPDVCIADSILKVSGVGLQEVAENAVHVYPNPADEMVNISVPTSGLVNIRILDLCGEEVLIFEGKGAQQQVSVGHLSTGIYLLEVSFDRQVKVQRLEIMP